MNDAQNTPLYSTPLESAMDTGTDDEPDLTIGDKHEGDAPDPNGDGVLTVAEAETLLGGEADTNDAPFQTKPATIEGK